MASMGGAHVPHLIARLDRSSLSTSAVLPNGPDGPAVIRNAKDAKKLAALDRLFRLKNQIYSDEDLAAWTANLEVELAKERSTLSVQTLRHRRRVRIIFKMVLEHNGVHVPDEEIFLLELVEKHGPKFIRYVYELIVPQVGYSVPSSKTILKYFYTFVVLVANESCTMDPEGKWIRAGYLALQNGLFQKMKSTTLLLIKDEELDRHGRVKNSFGKYEIYLVFSHMLEKSDSSRTKRIINLQVICQGLLVYYVTLRPSSMGTTSAENRDWGMYPKLGDVKIFREGYCKYAIQFEILNYKGYLNTPVGCRRSVLLGSVNKAHNVLFDVSLSFLALFWARGDFEKKYETLDDLLNDESPQLMIDPAKHDLPLFLMPLEGGHGFVDPPTPATNRTASQSFSTNAAEVGLPEGAFYAFRRGSSNLLAHLFGRRVAQMLLNHSEVMDTFDRFYDRGLLNYDLVGIRDRDEPSDFQAMDDRVTLFTGAAIECMTRRIVNKTTGPEHPLETSQIYCQRHPDVMELEDILSYKWSRMVAHFDIGGKYDNYISKRNLTFLQAGIQGEDSDYPLQPNSTPDMVQPLIDEIFDLIEKRLAVASGVRKNLTVNARSAMRATYRDKSKPIAGRTLADRQQAREELEEGPIRLVNDAVSMAKQVCFNGDVRAWAESLEEADALRQELVEEDEEPAPAPAILSLIGEKRSDFDAPDEATEEQEALRQFEADRNTSDKALTDMLQRDITEKEAAEPNVFGDIVPLGEIKRAMLLSLVKPCLKDGKMVTFVPKETECPECSKSFPSPTELKRHTNKHHNSWGALKDQILKSRDDEGQLHCPFCPGPKFGHIHGVTNHMTSNACGNFQENVKMKEEFDAANARSKELKRHYAKRTKAMDKAKLGQGDVDHSDFPMKATASTEWNVLETTAYINYMGQFQTDPVNALSLILGPPSLNVEDEAKRRASSIMAATASTSDLLDAQSLAFRLEADGSQEDYVAIVVMANSTCTDEEMIEQLYSSMGHWGDVPECLTLNDTQLNEMESALELGPSTAAPKLEVPCALQDLAWKESKLPGDWFEVDWETFNTATYDFETINRSFTRGPISEGAVQEIPAERMSLEEAVRPLLQVSAETTSDQIRPESDPQPKRPRVKRTVVPKSKLKPSADKLTARNFYLIVYADRHPDHLPKQFNEAFRKLPKDELKPWDSFAKERKRDGLPVPTAAELAQEGLTLIEEGDKPASELSSPSSSRANTPSIGQETPEMAHESSSSESATTADRLKAALDKAEQEAKAKAAEQTSMIADLETQLQSMRQQASMDRHAERVARDEMLRNIAAQEAGSTQQNQAGSSSAKGKENRQSRRRKAPEDGAQMHFPPSKRPRRSRALEEVTDQPNTPIPAASSSHNVPPSTSTGNVSRRGRKKAARGG